MPHSVIALDRKPAQAEPPPGASIAAHYVIVFGNEKGGTGKTTTAMHVAVALLKLGKKVAAIDLDSRQRTIGALYRKPRGLHGAHQASALPCRCVKVVKRRTANSDEMRAVRRSARRSACRSAIHHHRHAGQRYAAFAAWSCGGRHAGHADERQFLGFRPAGEARRRNARDQRPQPLHRIRLGLPQAPPDVAPARASIGW